MKKLVSLLLVLAIVCTSVFAFDVSLGAFFAKEENTISDGNVTAGGVVSVTYQPWTVEKVDLGFKGDFIVGDKNNEVSLVGALKAVASFDVDNLTFLGGVGVTANGLESGKIGLATEAAISYNFANNFSLGASFDCAFALRDFSFDPSNLGEVKVPFIPGGKVFVSYSF